MSVALTFMKPLVGVQHQVLFGRFQLLHQPLVLGSDLSDSLLPMLQDFQLGVETHDLLRREEEVGSGEGDKQRALCSGSAPQPPPDGRTVRGRRQEPSFPEARQRSL